MTNKQNAKILIVDDEPDILELLKYNLKKEGYQVETADDGRKAVSKAKEFLPNLILLDIMMPQQDGVETCRQLREIPEMSETHITFLTARAEEYSEIAAFEAGADDYITKPIKPRALMSRISSLFRKENKQKKKPQQIVTGQLIIDRSSYTVNVNGESFTLPRKEFELLYFLAQRPDKVFGRDELLKNIWGTDVYVLTRTVDVHIRKVREKIGNEYISTIKGVGYKFTEN